MSDANPISDEGGRGSGSSYESDLAFWYAIANEIPQSKSELRQIKSTLIKKLDRVRGHLDAIVHPNDLSQDSSSSQISEKLDGSLDAAFIDLYTVSDGVVDAFSPASEEYRFLRRLFRRNAIAAVSAYLYLTNEFEFDSIQDAEFGLNEAKHFASRYHFQTTVAENDWGGLVKTIEEALQSRFARYDNEIGSIKAGYVEDLQLKAPVQYWLDKRDYHRSLIGKFSIALSLFVLVVGGGYWIGAFIFFTSFGMNTPPLYIYGLSAAIGLMIIWIIRVLLRVLMSHIHLAMDANERRVMIMTYLSMLKESDTHAIEARELILKSIFRTANDGLISSDTMPSTPQIKQYFKAIVGDDA